MAARIAAALFGLVALFQVALVFGAPWGEYTQGGGVSGALPATGRVVAAISAVLLVGMACVILARAGFGALRGVSRRLIAVLAWLTVAYSAFGLLANMASPSVRERMVWAPVSALLLMLTLITVLSTRRTLDAASRSGDRGG